MSIEHISTESFSFESVLFFTLSKPSTLCNVNTFLNTRSKGDSKRKHHFLSKIRKKQASKEIARMRIEIWCANAYFTVVFFLFLVKNSLWFECHTSVLCDFSFGNFMICCACVTRRIWTSWNLSSCHFSWLETRKKARIFVWNGTDFDIWNNNLCVSRFTFTHIINVEKKITLCLLKSRHNLSHAPKQQYKFKSVESSYHMFWCCCCSVVAFISLVVHTQLINNE